MRYLSVIIFFILLTGYTFGQMEQLRYFEIGFRGKPDTVSVYAATSDAELLSVIDQELQRPESERNLHIDGLIKQGTRYNHYRYNWHIVPNRWTLTAERQALGTMDPRQIDEELDYFLGEEVRYSSAESYVKREVSPGQIPYSLSERGIEIYPNPVAEKLFVRLDEVPQPVRRAVLYDPQGRAVKIKELAAEQPGTLQFSVERLQAGFYTLSIRTEHGRWAEKVLVR